MPSLSEGDTQAVDPAGVIAPCSCHTSCVPTPAGEIIVVRVLGDVDHVTENVVQAALTEARSRRPSHLVVDVAGVGYCSIRGLALLVEAHAGGPAPVDTGHMLSGVAPRLERYLRLLWPADTLPARYPSAAAAVLAAMADQYERHSREPMTQHPRRSRTSPRPRAASGSDPTDDQLTERARAGDVAASRELARRHRDRVYRSVLRRLGSPDDPEDVAQDILTRLRMALAAFGEADPRDQQQHRQLP